jgi:hypothetical protein
MIDDKNSEIILCSGIKLDKNYENVLSYNEESMVNLCRNNQIYNAREYTFLGDTNYIDIECPYATSMYANYVAFINPTFGNKWIFAWVTDVKLMNPKTSRIYFDIDVWSTWFSRFNIGKAFIEREHVEDDTFGLHTIPEGLETGEYTIKDETDATDLQDVCPVVCATTSPIGTNANPNSYSSYCGNRYEALGYYIFKGSLATFYDGGDQADAIDAYIKRTNEIFSDDGIVSIFMAPKKLVGWTSDGTWTNFGTGAYSFRDALDVFDYSSGGQIGTHYDRPIKFSDLQVTRPTTFGNYTPINNKCFCYPFQYINLTNNNGGNGLYNYEDFSSNTPTFELSGIITPSCSIRAVPKNYKNQALSYNDGIQGAKYPICSWNNDLFTNYMTQQGVNIGLEIAKDVMTIGAGAVTGLATGGVASALGAGLASGGITGILNTMAQVRQHSLVPPQSRGNINGGDVGASVNKITFTAQRMQVKEEYIKVIDGYFSRFGYKVNEVKTPNINSRQEFNFIKVGGMDELVSGEIPADALEKVNSILRKGVTIFHNYTNIGNYTISNPIV